MKHPIIFTLIVIPILVINAKSTYALSIHVENDTYTKTSGHDKSYGEKEITRICRFNNTEKRWKNKKDSDHESESKTGECASYLHFNLDGLPTGLTVSSATLRIWVSKVKKGGQVDINLVLDSWDEETLTSKNLPTPGNLVITKAITKSDENSYISIDVADVVQSWIDGNASNYGFVLTPNTAENHINISLDTKENKKTSHPAELELLFSINNEEINDRLSKLEESISHFESVIKITNNNVTIASNNNLTLKGSNIYSHARSLNETKGNVIKSTASSLNQTKGSVIQSHGGSLNEIKAGLIKLN